MRTRPTAGSSSSSIGTRTGAQVAIITRDATTAAWLRQCLDPLATLWLDEADLYDALEKSTIGAVIVSVPVGASVGELLDRLGGRAPVIAVRREGPSCPDPRLFYRIDRRAAADDVAAVVQAAIRSRSTRPHSGGAVRRRQWILDACAQLPKCVSLADAAEALAEATRDLTGADRGACLFYDDAGGILWSEGPTPREVPAADGLAGFSARTGASIVVERAERDPRYRASIDDPAGDGKQRLLVTPVVASSGVTHAVLVAARSPERDAFDDASVASALALADAASPMLQHLEDKLDAQSARPGRQSVFRAEAVAAFGQRGEHGDVVRVAPRWTGWSFWALLLLIAAAVAFLCVGRVNLFSSGPAVVRTPGRFDVVATESGLLVEVLVESGTRVVEGTVLARLDARDAANAVARLTAEHETRLRNRIQDRRDPAVAQALVDVRARLEAAREAVIRREIRAPRGGVVGDVRVRAGQHVTAGASIVSVVPENETPELIALLPGGDLPRLARGQQVRLSLEGQPHAYHWVTLTDVATEVVGPTEAQRFLGPQLRDSIPITGPVVVVRAALDGIELRARDERFALHDGMAGHAEVSVRRPPVVFALFPALERLMEGRW